MRSAISVLTLCLVQAAWATQTPRDALVELMLADKPQQILEHLPVEIAEPLQKLPPEQLQAALGSLDFRKRMEREGATAERSDDAQILVILHKASQQPEMGSNDGQQVTLRLRLVSQFFEGSDALLVVKPEADFLQGDPPLFYVWMKLDSSSWRLLRVETPDTKLNLQDRDFVDHLSAQHFAQEDAAAAKLRTFTTALIQYQAAYPEIGLPQKLAWLGSGDGDGDCTPSAQHACFVGSDLQCDGDFCQLEGYVYDYQVLNAADWTFVITARPAHYGPGTMRSFYVDESVVVRATSEDRKPTADDSPLR